MGVINDMHTEEDLFLLLESLEEEAEKAGFELNIEPSTDDMDLFLVANMKTRKVACVGLTDISGINIIVSYMISLHKWKWYDTEGFSREEMVDKRKIRDDLFEFIPADQIIKKLSEWKETT